VRAFLLEPVTVLSFSQSGTRSRVHRPAYPDYIGVRKFDAEGRVIGEHGFLGLYTSRVYLERPERIPVVRRKVARVIERSGLDPAGFDGKVLNQVLATYPKDELFQISEDDLFQTAMGITYIHERRRTRLFVRHDPYGLFVHCLIYLPRDRTAPRRGCASRRSWLTPIRRGCRSSSRSSANRSWCACRSICASRPACGRRPTPGTWKRAWWR
jgi:NAD-specific glutamate dehydrogenase